MGYFFTLLFLVTSYVTPPVLFGPLSDLHLEIVIAFLAIVTSIPKFSGSGLLRAPQTFALAGLAFAVAASIIQSGWFGGAIGPLYGLSQLVVAFYLVAVNCRRKYHFIGIVLAFFLGSLFFIVMGWHDLQSGVVPSLFLYGDGTLRRLRGLGFVHDPNDFSQMLVSLVPCVFLWRKRNLIVDVFLIGIPLAVLVAGLYLTHSRGAMLALTAVILFAARRKIGTIPAAIVAGAMVAVFFAIGWSGGRDVSMDAGADRLDLWYDGMQSLKAHPLFGIGMGGFTDAFGITAHNSVIICAAETGVIGLFFWIMISVCGLLTATRLGAARPVDIESGNRGAAFDFLNDSKSSSVSDPKHSPEPEAAVPEVRPPVYLSPAYDLEASPLEKHAEDARQIAKLLLLALIGFLTAGWFISRAFSMWLFMYLGMIYAASRMQVSELERVPERFSRILRLSAVSTTAAIATLYVILRARNVFGH